MKTNSTQLVKLSVMGEVSSPVFQRTPYRISHDGQPMVYPGVGGITYNIRVGDLATGWMADHVEPGVSLENKEKEDRFPQGPNYALNVLACVGNEATIITGDQKGAKGVVTGKHGGIEHVMVDFTEEIMEGMVIGDKVMIKAYGVGLQLTEYPTIKVMNIDPRFLDAIGITAHAERLDVPVTHVAPAKIMGSGLGSTHTYSGDYDIQLFDQSTRQEYGLDDLRLGDLVAITDADHSYGRIYKTGAISIGIISHTDCIIAGHGPGVTTLFTSSTGALIPRISSQANIATILQLR